MKKKGNIISKILILAGCLIIIAAGYMKVSTEVHRRNLISSYKAYQEQLMDGENMGKIEESNSRSEEKDIISEASAAQSENIASKDTSPADNSKPVKEISQSLKTGDTIGIMSIPKIDLEAAICEGVDNKTIRYGIGHFPETSLPSQKGNFAVTGHRNYTFGEYFNRLDELENGDLVIVESGANNYTYEITNKFVAEPEELWVLDETEEATITLITCTPIRIATHRLILKGMLVENN